MAFMLSAPALAKPTKHPGATSQPVNGAARAGLAIRHETTSELEVRDKITHSSVGGSADDT